MTNILRNIRYAWQRVVRGYDDRFFWGVDEYLEQFIPAIKEFCEWKLRDGGVMGLNPQKAMIYEKTLRLIEKIDQMAPADYYQDPNAITEFWAFVGGNISAYWD